MDPSNPDVLYAASLERERREYGFLPGRSGERHLQDDRRRPDVDAAQEGLPTGDIGRIGYERL